jgi:hypothetical protein
VSNADLAVLSAAVVLGMAAFLAIVQAAVTARRNK